MNLADFHFIRPYWFLALLPMLIFISLTLKNKLARGNWTEVCDEALLPFILQETNNQSTGRATSFLMSLAGLLAIIALAGPTWERLPTPAFRNDAALVIALDLSRSMNATDIKPSRLIRARYKIADILKQRKDGLTALTVYAGDTFTVTPLTEDTETINSQLNALNTDIMPSQGSNTLAAIQLAIKLLQQAGQQQGAILLITDGINPSLLNSLNKLLGKYTLSILGIGTADGAPVQLNDGGFLKDRQGNIVLPRLEPSQLRSLASSGNGIYQTISSNDQDINAIMSVINSAPKQESKDQKNKHLVEQWVEQGPWLLLILLPLAAMYFRKGLLIIPLLVLFNYPQDSYAFGWQDLWETPDQQAQQAFDNKQYEQAAKQFTSPEWQAAAHYKAEQFEQSAESLQPIQNPSADSYYNQATALAKSGKLEEAIKSYDQALKINPKHEDALYNKDLVEKALEKQKQDQQKQNKDQDQKDKSGKDQSDKDQQKNDKQPGSSDNKDGQQDQKQQNNEQNKSEAQQDQQSQQSSKDKESQDKKDEQSAQQSDAEKKKREAEKDKAKSEKAQKENEDAKDKQDEDLAQQSKEQTDDETKQAQEQWLKRIPDDPSGLLKRKFKYQYNQRNQSSQQEESW